MSAVFDHLERAPLATLPTPLEAGPTLGDASRLWVKRDDLTGLGGGGNKARKLEFLCGDAVATGARSLVTVGAAQSNHCRMTAAAGLASGSRRILCCRAIARSKQPEISCCRCCSGRSCTFTGAEESHWGELEIAREEVSDQLVAEGLVPYAIPIGGSTAVGALGYAAAFIELLDQCDAAKVSPSARGVHVVEWWHPCRAARWTRRCRTRRPSRA